MSAILKAEDLNDFISPGVACIKPVESVPAPANGAPEYGEVEIQIDNEGNPLEISKIDGKQQKLSAAQISLADCLACSGCITSAEEVLVAQHSFDQLVNTLDSQKHSKVFAASVCHQARSSLAQAFQTSVENIDCMLVDLFVNQMGFKYVVGTSLGRRLSLVNEFEHVYQRKKDQSSGPILSSVCPGWVLYAEKTHPEVLDRLSTVKSPQQFTGCLLKSLVKDVPRENIYHVSIMPCFDKKLESARPELNEPKVSDVDCVLTPRELVNLVEQNDHYNFNFSSPLLKLSMSELYKKVAPPNWPFLEHSWSNDDGSTSGGWGFNYLLQYQQKLLEEAPDKYRNSSKFNIKRINGKNNDIYELRLEYDTIKVASTAVVNGFRNIQNLVRKLKAPEKAAAKPTGRAVVARRRMRTSRSATPNGSDEAEDVDATKCDYVEIMACPNGCINGGGQISHGKDVSDKEWLDQCVMKYKSIQSLDLNKDVVSNLMNWCNNFYEDSNISSDRLTTTYFKEVEKPQDQASILLGSKW
ncbi:Cytosolic Fe-S cluster assembly factor nar1 [Scheffersomyces spartinae]|uniref:Cytosolic Fe-S cluster assembly factor NAR1 n=1 Tax=Scheffersomyces spartinae TaxID=45513 RepID=A0A9P7V618_9ASCO|nr:Cytosolic Fe-S cluster assembly factor nar1 [Scheffersomyces spartinae]KAG7191584.1 Cytosolic Fe-S cluster assembly factor nar1 [Scheffersomyces spartinae]